MPRSWKTRGRGARPLHGAFHKVFFKNEPSQSKESFYLVFVVCLLLPKSLCCPTSSDAIRIFVRFCSPYTLRLRTLEFWCFYLVPPSSLLACLVDFLHLGGGVFGAFNIFQRRQVFILDIVLIGAQ